MAGLSILKSLPGVRRFHRYLTRMRVRAVGMLRARRDWKEFRRSSASERDLAGAEFRPILGEWTGETTFDRHYVYHAAWAIRRILQQGPESHVDFASSLHFVAALSASLPVSFFDYRPAEIRLDGLDSGEADLTALPFPSRSLFSISCMHVVEHIGLGRYGDPIDPAGDAKATAELQRVLAEGGRLYFVVPVGAPRLVFNRHRIYHPAQVVEAFGELRLAEFTLIPDNAEQGHLIENADFDSAARQRYGCGCFLFVRDR